MCFENVETHDVRDGIVENKTKEVEFDNRMKPAGKVVKKCGEIALLGDGLANFEQGFELTPGVFERGGKRHFRRRDDRIRHTWQDSTRVGEGSTADGRGLVRAVLQGCRFSSFSLRRKQIGRAHV